MKPAPELPNPDDHQLERMENFLTLSEKMKEITDWITEQTNNLNEEKQTEHGQ